MPKLSRPNFRSAALVLALPAVLASGSAAAAFQLRVPLDGGAACAQGACAGGGPLTLDVTEIPMYTVLPPDYVGQPEAYYDIPARAGSQGGITVSGGTAPYTFSLQLKEITSLYVVQPWHTCSPAAWEGAPENGTTGVTAGMPGGTLATCVALSLWGAASPSTNSAAYSVNNVAVTGNVTTGGLDLALYIEGYDVATGVSYVNFDGSGYILRYQLTVTDSAGRSVTSPVKLHTVPGF